MGERLGPHRWEALGPVEAVSSRRLRPTKPERRLDYSPHKISVSSFKSKGVEIAGGVQAFADAEGNVRTFFAYDPDGILVQFDAGMEG